MSGNNFDGTDGVVPRTSKGRYFILMTNVNPVFQEYKAGTKLPVFLKTIP